VVTPFPARNRPAATQRNQAAALPRELQNHLASAIRRRGIVGRAGASVIAVYSQSRRGHKYLIKPEQACPRSRAALCKVPSPARFFSAWATATRKGPTVTLKFQGTSSRRKQNLSKKDLRLNESKNLRPSRIAPDAGRVPMRRCAPRREDGYLTIRPGDGAAAKGWRSVIVVQRICSTGFWSQLTHQRAMC